MSDQTNKVRVTKLFGTASTLGVMNPKVGMTTNQGTITALGTDNATVRVSGAGVEQERDFYPHQLLVTEAHATGSHAWPSGDGSVVFGHGTGVSPVAGTGMVYTRGFDAVTFTR